MKDLDSRLREIIAAGLADQDLSNNEKIEPIVKSIKAAFADENNRIFKEVDELAKSKGIDVMTGQEWYDRFEKGLEKPSGSKPYFYVEILKTAKEAAGL